MIMGIGIDILDRSRLTTLLLKQPRTSRNQLSIRSRLAQRILSGRERSSAEWKAVLLKEAQSDRRADHRGSPIPSPELISYLANRWTTKEAAYKALYPVHQVGWKELSLLKGESSQPKKPVLLFHPSSAPSSGSTSDSDHYQLHPHISLLVSISHDGPFTIASVLANSSSSSASTEHHNTLMSSS